MVSKLNLFLTYRGKMLMTIFSLSLFHIHIFYFFFDCFRYSKFLTSPALGKDQQNFASGFKLWESREGHEHNSCIMIQQRQEPEAVQNFPAQISPFTFILSNHN